jgi:hypothetical protein
VLVGIGFLEQSGPKFTPDQRAQVARISQGLQNELKELAEWISRPSVDLPVAEPVAELAAE